MDLTAVLTSLVFVWPSNWGSPTFTEITAARPSRMSSPVRLATFAFSSFWSLAYLLTTVVSALRKPSSWVPPSRGVDGVGEGMHRLGIACVPLHGDLNLDLVLVTLALCPRGG